MKPSKNNPKNIDDYIDGFPKDIQRILKRLRWTIQKAAPVAKEIISYRIPTFALHGNLVHFAAFKHHIGFYPTSSAIKAFEKDLSSYEVSKGTIRFPLDQPLPMTLVARIVKYRVKESLDRQKGKKSAVARKK